MCIPRLLATTLYLTAIHSCIITECAYSEYSHLFSHHDCMHIHILLLYHYCMWKHRLQPLTLVSILYVHTEIAAIHSHTITVWCTLRLEASTLVSLLNVRPWTTTIHSCIITVCAYSKTTTIQSCIITLFAQTMGTYSFINTVCAPFNYSHPLFCQYCMCILNYSHSLLYYCIHTGYRHILFYHYCMCTLGLQPFTLVPILYMHPQTTTTYSSMITVCSYSDYSHPLLYQYLYQWPWPFYCLFGDTTNFSVWTATIRIFQKLCHCLQLPQYM